MGNKTIIRVYSILNLIRKQGDYFCARRGKDNTGKINDFFGHAHLYV